MRKRKSHNPEHPLSWHSVRALYYNTKGVGLTLWQMHDVLLIYITKLVDDVVCALPFSTSTHRLFGMYIAKISALFK